MKIFSQILSFLLPVLYLGVIYIYYLIFSGKKKTLVTSTTFILIVLLAIHGIVIAMRNIALGTMPLSTVHDAYSFLAFSILFVYMFIEMGMDNRGSGLFIVFFAFVLEMVSSLNHSWEPETNELLKSPTFAIHASLALMGYTALSLAAIYALMYIVQNYNLKKRNLGKLFMQFPALTYMEKMSKRSVLIGIILLGIGILLGHIQAMKIIGSFWPNDIKVVISDTVWLLYLGGYILSYLKKWRGERMAYVNLSGYLMLMIGSALIIYLSESFHRFN